METKYKTKPLMIFIMIVFGLTYIFGGVLYFVNNKIILSNLIMLFPAISAIIVWIYFYKHQKFTEFFSLRIGKLKYWAIYPFTMIIIITLIYLISYVVNPNQFLDIFDIMHKLLIPLVVNITVGVLVSLVAYLGEELGWRAFMYPILIDKLGTKKGLLSGGIIWGFWHLPLILQGHNYPNNPSLGVFLMVAMCIPLGIILYYTYLKTKSVFMPAVLHGIFNQFSTTVYMFALKGSEFNSLIYGPTGVIGIIVLSIFALILILKIDNIDRKS